MTLSEILAWRGKSSDLVESMRFSMAASPYSISFIWFGSLYITTCSNILEGSGKETGMLVKISKVVDILLQDWQFKVLLSYP